MTMMRPILIHIHIPKTAGSTLNAMISEGLGEHRQFVCARDEDAEKLAAMSQTERDRIDFVFGHYNYGLHKFFTRRICYISCLREPRQRILSFYRFVIANEEHPLHNIVRRNSHDFSSFLQLAVEAPRIQDPIDNVQVRMLAGSMGLGDDYENLLSSAKSHTLADEFLLGDFANLKVYFAKVARVLQLEFGPTPTPIVAEAGLSIDKEMERLDSDAQDILKRFVRWDACLQSAEKEIATGEGPSSHPDEVAVRTVVTMTSAGMMPPASEDLPVPTVVSALYRLLLLREADSIGLDGYAREIQDGVTIAEVMRRILRSPEFGGNLTNFLRMYLSPEPLSNMDLEQVTHSYDVGPITFALNKAAKDTYTEQIRRGPTSEQFIQFILRRAKLKGCSLKVADFGANVGAVSLPLAANGLNLLAIEAIPANFLALATAARLNGLSNLLPVNMAAMDRAGLVSFSGTSAWATAGIAGGDVTVSCDTIVNILQSYNFSDADVIKIDIEGAELPALHGAEAFFADRPETEVIFESNNHTCHLFGYDRQDLLRWFAKAGFSTYAFRADGLMPVQHDDPQPVPVVDILATKRSADALEQQGETIVAMTDDYILRELSAISTSRLPAIRKHFITEAGRVGDSVNKLPLWSTIASAMVAP
jgi:FkbM family methyltransferase